LLLGAAAIAAVLGAGAAQAQAQAPSQPHVVVVMTDDLDTHTLETLLRLGFLPNIERHITGRGVRFAQSFVTNSLCCPSRATFLSGQYSHNHGVLKNDAPHGGVSAFADGSALPVWLQAAGYRTVHLGKYLNDYGRFAAAPEDSPFNPHYVPPGWSRWEALVDPSTYNVYSYRLSLYNDRTDATRRGTLRAYGDEPADYQTRVLGERAAAIVLESRVSFPGQPLFLTVAPIAPHVELFSIALTTLDGLQHADQWRWFIRPDPADRTAKPARWRYLLEELPFWPSLKPSWNEADVSDKPTALQRPALTDADGRAVAFQYRTRFASMLAVDDMVGRIAAALGPELDRTVLMLTSDNGFLYGEHRLAEKLAAYEESIRVPLYVAMPGQAAAHASDALVINNDLAPTIAALAGIVPPGCDGRSLAAHLLGGPAPARKRVLVEHWRSEAAGAIDLPTFSALRTGAQDAYPDRLYVEYYEVASAPASATAVELYDLTEPQGVLQLVSRHADPARAGEIAYLKGKLGALKTCGQAGSLSCAAAEE
jgi:arylsulfatase A-like enzyme